MEKLVVLLAFLSLVKTSGAQNDTKRLELGPTIITANSFYHSYDPFFRHHRPLLEFVNGLFFRYNKKRFGLRVYASYNNKVECYESGIRKHRDIRAGVGGQFSPIEHEEWMYVFLDISYHNYASKWRENNFFGNSTSSTNVSHSSACFLGLGFKIKTFRSVYLSPEVGYFNSYEFKNTSTPSLYGRYAPGAIRYRHLNLSAKLHLTVKF